MLQSVTPWKSILFKPALEYAQDNENAWFHSTQFCMIGGIMVNKKHYVAIAAFLLAALVLFAGCRHSSPAHRADKMIGHISDELDLTPVQKEMLEQFKEEMLDRRDKMQAERHLQMEVLMTEIKKDTMDKDRLMAMYEASKPKFDDAAAYVVSSMVEFHSTLTPDQRAKLIENLERLKKWHSYMHD